MSGLWGWDADDVEDMLNYCPCMAFHSHGYCICEDDREVNLPPDQYVRMIIYDELAEFDEGKWDRLVDEVEADE